LGNGSVKNNLHAEGLVSFLETAHGEELEGVDIVAKVEPDLLSDVEAASRNKVLADDLAEGRISGAGINQQLAVLRETGWDSLSLQKNYKFTFSSTVKTAKIVITFFKFIDLRQHKTGHKFNLSPIICNKTLNQSFEKNTNKFSEN